jgi:hypothetical protein
VAQVDANGRIQAIPVAQADFGRNLKPAPAAKLLVFSDFLLLLSERCFSFFASEVHPRGTKSTTAVASKVRFTRQSKVDFFSRNSKSAPRGILKLTSVFKSHLKVRAARNKVNFGFKSYSKVRTVGI